MSVFYSPVHFLHSKYIFFVKLPNIFQCSLTRVLFFSLPVLLLVSLPTASVPVLVRVAREGRRRREE